MARRTKQDAQATRDLLLDAAELVFQQRGVSRTSLNEIAAAAGVSRGAIYWHFQDKADLFNAMMSRVTLPMEAALEPCGDLAPQDPLALMRASVIGIFDKLVADPQARRVFEIATHKVEYVDELSGVRNRHLSVRCSYMTNLTQSLEQAIKGGRIGSHVAPQIAAVGLHALLDGLIQNWTLDPDAFDLRKVGEQALDTYFRGLGAAVAVPSEVSASKRSRQCSRTP